MLEKLVPIGAGILGVLALSKGKTLTGAVALGGAVLMWRQAQATTPSGWVGSGPWAGGSGGAFGPGTINTGAGQY